MASFMVGSSKKKIKVGQKNWFLIFLPFTSVWKDSILPPCLYKVFHHVYFGCLHQGCKRAALYNSGIHLVQVRIIESMILWQVRYKRKEYSKKVSLTGNVGHLILCSHGVRSIMTSHYTLCCDGRRGDGKATHPVQHTLFAKYPH